MMDAKFCGVCDGVIEQDGVLVHHVCGGRKLFRSAIPLDYSIMEMVIKWAAMRSKDPSTKVGACVYDDRTGAMFFGYNGFPKGVPDYEVMWNAKTDDTRVYEFTKYDLVVHAEINAIQKTLRAGVDIELCRLFVSHFPCPRCMKDAIGPSGLKTVIYQEETYPSLTAQSKRQTQILAGWIGISIKKVSPDGR